MTSSLKTLLFAGFTTLLQVGCASGALEIMDITNDFEEPETERLRYFKEINVSEAHKRLKLSGSNVRITIMGETVDATHPDLHRNVVGQYNTFSDKNRVLRGEGNLAYGDEFLGRDDGHGTHIAGTIAAACDGLALQGVACQASLDVYDIGAYQNMDKFPNIGWNDASEEARFLGAFAAALKDVTRRNESKIITGSFNIEAPALPLKKGGAFDGKPIDEIGHKVKKIKDLSKIISLGYATLENPLDEYYLNRMARTVDEPEMLPFSLLLSQTKEWKNIESALEKYQNNDGVYIVTESNNLFENHTSLLNAMPTISDKVDADGWISVVMVTRKETAAGPMSGDYVTEINTCGQMAADYCLITPSYFIFSAMTERVAFGDDMPLFILDGRGHQILEGHSMGAPMIAAGLALLEEYNQKNQLEYSMTELAMILKTTGNKTFPGFDPKLHGQGMLDIGAALKKMGASLGSESDFTPVTLTETVDDKSNDN